MEMTQKKAKVERTLQGVVVTAKAEKTVSVSVERVVQHPMYGKTIKKKTTFLAHDEEKKCKPGDIVTIQPVRPLSKRKRWLVIHVIPMTQKVEVPNDTDADQA
jgi:small subunit ribosomal protein S17